MDKQNQELRFSEQGEKLIGKRWKVLDKGYVGLVSYHGTDYLIEASARTSYQKGTRSVLDTKKLIRYLYANNHHSPFEMSSCTFELKMPLFVIQQLLRHRTAKLNQESHRYSEVSSEVYRLKSDEWRLQSKNNKQGSDGYLPSLILDGQVCGSHLTIDDDDLQKNIRLIYEKRLDAGVAKELARKDIPHSTYSKLYWQMDLRNLLHFMSLRCDEHAQIEIRNYSNIIGGIIKKLFPFTFEAWYDYNFNAKSLSLIDRKFLAYLLKKYHFDDFKHLRSKHEESGDQYPITLLGMSKREVDDFWDKFEINERGDFDLDISSAKTFEDLEEDNGS